MPGVLNTILLMRANEPMSSATDSEKIALDTLKMMVTAPLTGFNDTEIQQMVQHERSFLKQITLPSNSFDRMTDKRCAEYEDLLADFLPTIPWLRDNLTDRAFKEEMANAESLAQAIDAYRAFAYWHPLTAFLHHAEPPVWNRWRASVFAGQRARAAVSFGAFDAARSFAVYGLQQLDEIPDIRHILRLSIRLQCAIAQGDGATGLATHLGKWIAAECERIGNYLLAACMTFNLGNQCLLNGKIKEADKWLRKCQRISKSSKGKYLRNMDWYRINVLERMAAVKRRQMDLSGMKSLLDEFRQTGTGSRVEILYEHNMGLYYEYSKEYKKAEAAFKKVTRLAKTPRQDYPYEDPYNAWASHVALACLALKAGSSGADEALRHLDEAKKFGDTFNGFMNAERSCTHLVFCAEAYLRKGRKSEAEQALQQIGSLLQQVDSMRLAVRKKMLDAHLSNDHNRKDEARSRYFEAKTLAQTSDLKDLVDEIDQRLAELQLT